MAEDTNSSKKMNILNDDIKNKEKKDDVVRQMQEAKEELKKRLQLYLDNTPRRDTKQNEFEIRFGTKSYGSNKPISKTDYDNVVRQLKTAGFYSTNENGEQLLRINPEYKHPKTGENMISNIRAEIRGLYLIESYCQSNDIQKLLSQTKMNADAIIFTQKMGQKGADERFLKPIDFTDMNFRASYQVESDYNKNSAAVQQMISSWGDSKKVFRFMNRVRFQHPDYPIFADLSIVRSSKTRRGQYGSVPIPEYTIQKANVFKNPVVYEIEFELDNQKVGPGTPYNKNVDQLLGELRKCIRIVMGGLQSSTYPISNSERERVLETYEKILFSEPIKQQEPSKKYRRIPFIGPSSVPLQIENIIDSETSDIPNIRMNYTVTDKADGERMLMLINDEGLIYFIDKNMNVIFTGSKTNEKRCFNSILDGEYIKYGRANRQLNLYAAFDIYFINKKSVREKAFAPVDSSTQQGKSPEKTLEEGEVEEDRTPKDTEIYRLPLLSEFILVLKPVSILPENNQSKLWKEVLTNKTETVWMNIKTGVVSKTKPDALKHVNCKLHVECKKFYIANSTQSIFNGCEKILNNETDGIFPYNIDGLIFTPANTGVGTNRPGEAAEYSKNTWNLSFKWKPSKYNSVDFLVSVVKDKAGKDKVSNLYQDGVGQLSNITQFKTLELRCGFDKVKHMFTNPFHSVIMGNFPKQEISQEEENDTYIPMRFVPSNPYQSDAGFTNIKLVQNGENMLMLTEDGEYFDEDTIVEFKYDMSRENGWRWIPIRVRHDKTQKMQTGKREFGNAYHVANDIWKSYYSPVTDEMIKTGENIPYSVDTLDIYYNKSADESRTKSLRNFHNLFVKRKLIMGISNREDILIDYAVGKAGDLAKWIQSKLSFVFGIDIANDNIINMVDGACTRYLKEHKTTENIPGAIFLNGNSSKNIRDGSAFLTDENKKICKAIFGQGAKDASLLGRGVYNQYDVAADGFHISSCQFAVHYFFETQVTLHGFLRNLAECTRLQGYFIGTCYDGETIFKLLKNKKEDESVAFMTDNIKKQKICEITKKYSETGFPEDELSIGYAIDVFQETINKTFREFLVNFNFFQRILENYGFTLITPEEARQHGLPNATGLFNELYHSMETEIAQDRRKKANYKDALNMSYGEKALSFMNRYFIFRKTTTVNASQIERDALKRFKMVNLGDEDMGEGELNIQMEEHRKAKAVTGKIKKLKVKIILEKKNINQTEDVMTPENDMFTLPASERLLTEDVETENIEPVPKKREEIGEKLEEIDESTDKSTDKSLEEEKEKKPEKVLIRIKKLKKKTIDEKEEKKDESKKEDKEKKDEPKNEEKEEKKPEKVLIRIKKLKKKTDESEKPKKTKKTMAESKKDETPK
jgi:hypothetical protein